ncbi:MAG: hypothetical protein SOW41_01020 [Anaerococcus sp.]|jgi:predicted membrane protein|nr:hypothetical protein [Peptoniphilaceae bacterium]MDY3054623.1 hypothetical protein [Anaerococcus sp.]
MNKKRHGVDEFGIALIWFAIILVVISYFTQSKFLSTLGGVIVIFEIYRTLSSNIIKRNSENYIFKAKFLNPVKAKLKKLKRSTVGDKNYKYITCKNCGQELRVPKGKGKIRVKCPKCKEVQEIRS